MSKIKIKNFGPITKGFLGNDGWLDIHKVTIFIGNQGSGKSTIAKLISTFLWIEKALVRGDFDKKYFKSKNIFKNQYLNYHRLESYLKTKASGKTIIEFQGDAYCISYKDGSLEISENNNISNYPLPQIMYVPAERNFISYVKTPKELKLSSDSLKEFLTEYDNAKENLKGLKKLPINNTNVEYDKINDRLDLKGNNYKVNISDASSGFQSLVPLYLVSDYLASSVRMQSSQKKDQMSSDERSRFKEESNEILSNSDLTMEQKRIAISVLSSKFNKSSFINIVEEPEQNLFPTSQWELLKSLLKFNNYNESNRLIMTTHSPYIVNYMSIVIQADNLWKSTHYSFDKENLRKKIKKVIPKESLVTGDDVAIYELDESDGSITMIDSFEGIPVENNYLNNMLVEGNNLFDELLEIEEEL